MGQCGIEATGSAPQGRRWARQIDGIVGAREEVYTVCTVHDGLAAGVRKEM
jgi:hypothetical protein